MSDHIGLDNLSAYLDAELTNAELGEAEQHLATCPDCRAELESLRWTVDLTRSMPRARIPAGASFRVPVADRAPERHSRIRPLLAWLAVGAAAAAVIVGVGVGRLTSGSLTGTSAPRMAEIKGMAPRDFPADFKGRSAGAELVPRPLGDAAASDGAPAEAAAVDVGALTEPVETQVVYAEEPSAAIGTPSGDGEWTEIGGAGQLPVPAYAPTAEPGYPPQAPASRDESRARSEAAARAARDDSGAQTEAADVAALFDFESAGDLDMERSPPEVERAAAATGETATQLTAPGLAGVEALAEQSPIPIPLLAAAMAIGLVAAGVVMALIRSRGR